MEPWDGPAAVAFTDGSLIGAVLDRNGLRPARYWVRDDGLVVLASEVGVLDMPTERVVRKGRLQPGKMFLVDTVGGRIPVDDDEIKAELAGAAPYREWLEENLLDLADLPPRQRLFPGTARSFASSASSATPTRSWADPRPDRAPHRAVGSMGSDTPIPVLSDRPRLLFDYFTQLFAGDESAAGCAEGGARHLPGGNGGPGAQPSRARSGILSPDHPAVPCHRRRRPREAPLRQRARRDAGLSVLCRRRALHRLGERGWSHQGDRPCL